MFHDDCVGSSGAIDQAWFAMLLVNDPNTELVGSLRPPRENVLRAALRKVFAWRDGGGAFEQPARLRSRAPLWVTSALIVAALSVAGADALRPHFALAGASSEQASPRSESTALMAHSPPLLRVEPAPASSARPLRDLLDVRPAATPTTAVAVARGVAQGKAAPKAGTKASRRHAPRNWLATHRVLRQR